MKDSGNPLARALNLTLIAGAWLIVPGGERTEWWREWRAELWQARHEHACDGRISWMSERAGSFVMLMSFDPDRRDQERKTKFNNSRCTSKCKKSFIYWRLVNFPCHLEQLVFAPWPDQVSSSRDETFEPSRRAAARRAKQDRGARSCRLRRRDLRQCDRQARREHRSKRQAPSLMVGMTRHDTF